MKSTDLNKRIDELKVELEQMRQSELSYAANPAPSKREWEEHFSRVQRFREITAELVRLAEDTAR